MSLKIGELARRAGLTVRTLRHYDDIGLLSPSARSESGYRLYDETDAVRLQRIQALKQFGWSLVDIGTFLADPGSSLADIITQQIRALEERVRRTQTLRDRLFQLRERISKGEDAGLTDWLTILEAMAMYERHFSKEELEALRSNRGSVRDEERRRLVSQVQALIDGGVSPESEEAREPAIEWMAFLSEVTGNNPALAMKLKRIHAAEPRAQLLSGITPGMVEYVARALAGVRTAILAEYLSPDELERVRSRHAEHAQDWPPLIAEARRQMERGAAANDPAVQALAVRWESLFRASYSGGDPKLAEKIRSAFANEPELPLGVGMDSKLIELMREAVRLLHPAPADRGSGAASHGSPPKPSALRVAILRAAHQLLDSPLIFEDPLALKILGEAEEEALRSDPSRYNTPLLRGLRTSLAVRSRLAEDERARSRERGVRQCVILGAGLDTTAYRDRRDDGTRIFEVDHPEMQQWKRSLLQTVGLKAPESLAFVPLDFESFTLAEALQQAGFHESEPAFFSWLGVTMYLEEDAVLETLRYIASLAPGSGVVFDYGTDPSLLSPKEKKSLELLSARTAEHGEPWKTFFAPAVLVGKLRSLGFNEAEDLGPEEVTARYLSGRADGLRKSGVSRLICARV